MRALSVVFGTLAALYGGFKILLVLGFSTMIGHDLPDAARAAEQRRAIFAEIPEIGVGLLLIIVGIWLVFSKPRFRAVADALHGENRNP
jgi:hypothetical protein